MKKIKIIDLSTLIPGPFTSFLLGKYLPAETVKFEDINSNDPLMDLRPTRNGISLSYQLVNNKKKVVSVDWRSDGVEKFRKESKTADIIIENFKSDHAVKLGLGFEEVVKTNPKIVYCSIRGYDKKNPLSGKSAHDLNILALSGYLDLQIKTTHQFALPPIQLADLFTAYHASVRILAALIEKKHGFRLQLSMFEAFLEAMSMVNEPQLTLKKEVVPTDFLMSGQYPCYGLYTSKDGRSIAVAALELVLWTDFCHNLGRSDLLGSQFEKKAINDVASEIKKYKASYWLDRPFDFCVSPVLSINEAAKLKYVRE